MAMHPLHGIWTGLCLAVGLGKVAEREKQATGKHALHVHSKVRRHILMVLL
jgi:hypothetical protein